MNKYLEIATKTTLSLTTLLTITTFAFPGKTYASNISTDILEYRVEAGDFEFGALEFTNTEKQPIKIEAYIKSYNPKEESFIDTKPFIGLQQNTYTVNPNQTVTIEYAISIPKDQPLGTYFNVIAIEPLKAAPTEASSVGVSIKNGFGALLTFHVQEADNTIDRIFIDKSETQLIVERRGFPFLSPMKLRYIFVNNSNFVFRPEGEIRITNQNGNQIDQRVQINPDGKAIYPDEKVEIVKEFDIWKNPEEVLDSKIISSRTYNGFTENYLTNQVEVAIREQLITAGVVISVGIVSILAVLVKLVKSRGRSNTKSEPAE